MTDLEKVLNGPYWEWLPGCVLTSGTVVTGVKRLCSSRFVETSEWDADAKEYEWAWEESAWKKFKPDIYEPATAGIMLHLARKRWGDDFQPIRVVVSGGPDFFVAYKGGPTFKHEEDLLWDALIPEEPSP